MTNPVTVDEIMRLVDARDTYRLRYSWIGSHQNHQDLNQAEFALRTALTQLVQERDAAVKELEELKNGHS